MQSNRTSNAPSPRIPAIDGLRAAAILIVMVSHGGLGRIVPGGFGVSVFFFLSGYLITTLMRLEFGRGGRVDLPAFYARRAARILPPLWLTIALVLALRAAGWLAGETHTAGTLSDLLFLTNYAGVLGLPDTTPIPLWSLDVEEHFYLLFPLLFILLASRARRRVPAVLLAICLAVLGVRIATYAAVGPSTIYYWSHTRIDSIMWGTILAMWQNPVLDERPWRPRPALVAGAFAVILGTFVVRDPFFRETFRYTLQGAALLVLFSAAIQSRGIARRVLDSRPLRVVALLSYTLYLIHFPLLQVTAGLPAPLGVPVAYLAAFGWAALLYVVVERPIARWRKRSLEAHLRKKAGVPAEGTPA